MNRISVAAALVSLSALAQPITPVRGPALTGSTQVVNNGPGDQYDPHISNDLVSYTDFSVAPSQIRYQHLAVAGSDRGIPNNGAQDVVSDVNNNFVVYMHITNAAQAIYLFDTTTAAAPSEVDPVSGEIRADPTIGGTTIAWEDSTLSPSGSDIVAYDRTTNTATYVTSDGASSVSNVNPAVDNAGAVIAWTKCTTSTSCHIWSAVKTGTTWTTHPLTSGSGVEELPDTNGTIVVYDSLRSGHRALYWQPVAGGTEAQLVLPGEARAPHVSGNYIAFEYRDTSSTTNSSWDIYLYDVTSNTLYQVTNTPNLDEVLNDDSIDATGLVRVVWAVNEATNGYNVYAFAFAAPSSNCSSAPGDGDDDDENATTACANPVGRTLLATLTVTRTSGEPNQSSTTFASTESRNGGLACLNPGTATAGWVVLGDDLIFGPSSFGGHGDRHHDRDDRDREDDDQGSTARHVELEEHNTLNAWIAGEPGSSYTVRVYGPRRSCSSGTSDPDRLSQVQQSLNASGTTTAAMGCSLGGGELAVAAVLALLGLLLGRRPAPVPVRQRRR